jgi:hypothetical protein
MEIIKTTKIPVFLVVAPGFFQAPLNLYMVSELDLMVSSSFNIVNPLLSQPVSEKLTKSNHVLWNAQVRATI